MLYLFDSRELLAVIIHRENIKSLVYEEALNTPRACTAEIVGGLPNDISYFGHRNPEDASELLFYRIDKIETVDNHSILTGIEAAYDEMLHYGFIRDKRFFPGTVETALSAILEGSRFGLGDCDMKAQEVKTNFYYVSRLDALKNLIGKVGGELRFRLSWDGQRIVSRKLDFVRRLGRDRGKRFVHGYGLLETRSKASIASIVTGLVGRGKGVESTDPSGNPTGGYGRRIDFKEIVWSVANGDPVDKPKGQDWVELSAGTARYNFADGKARLGMVEFDECENPAELLRLTYDRLVDMARPKTTYKAAIRNTGKLDLGETVAIVRKDLGIAYKTRIFKREVDALNPSLTKVELGDRIENYQRRQNTELLKRIKNVSENTSAALSGLYADVADAKTGDIAADRIKGGTQASEDGSTSINWDTGNFDIQGAIKVDNGELELADGYTTIVKHGGTQTAVHPYNTTDNYIGLIGTATVQNGRCEISLDSLIASLCDTCEVFVSAYGNAKLWVSEHTPARIVVQSDVTTGAIEFAWEVKGRRRR